MRTTETTITNTLITPMLTPAMSIRSVGGMTCGTLTGDGPYMIWMMFWRMNDTPMAVRSGARRGAFRSGR